MRCVEEKLNKNKSSLIVGGSTSKIKKRINKIKLSEDDKQILGDSSRSKQSWSNVPRFHMDKIMGKSDKAKQEERLEKILKKRN